MNMQSVLDYLVGSVSYVPLKQKTNLALKCSISVMGLFTRILSMVASGCAVISARKHTIWPVSHKKKKKTSNGPSCAGLMNAKSDLSERVVKRVVKRVIFPTCSSVPGPRQKTTPSKKRGKDGRRIAPRKEASAGRNRKEQQWTEADMDEVFDLFERNKTLPPGEQMSIRAISKQTGVPYTTCCERLKGRRGGGKRGKIAGGKRTGKMLDKGERVVKRVITPKFRTVYPLGYPLTKLHVLYLIDQEQRLAAVLKLYARRGFPFTPRQMCQLAYEMAVKEGQNKFSPVKKSAGRTWLKYFLRRNPDIRIKNSVNLNIARAMAANPVQINKFFEEYKYWLADWKLEYAPNSIWNVDECGIGDVPKPQRVVGVSGERAFQTVAGEKATNTTMVTYASAGGLLMKPMLIFKCAKIKAAWREAAPSGYFLKASKTGYINAKLFYDYGVEFIDFLKRTNILQGNNKAILLMDLHKAHLFNWEFMLLMKNNNVEVCGLPPHCTHVLQPLDDRPFGNFKKEYQKELLHMNRALCGNKMNRQQFFRVFVPSFEAMTADSVRSGFRNTGIYPRNPNPPKMMNVDTSTVFDRCKCMFRGDK